MSNDCWFNLPNGETATELELTIPVRGRVKIRADQVAELDSLKDLLNEHAQRRSMCHHGPLRGRLESTLSHYEGVAAEALNGANNVRDDMVAYLRSVVFVLETVVGDHLNHFQKNERIRGAMAVLERHIQSLREERFNFRDSLWRRDRDLFRWNENERRLREQIAELKREKSELVGRLAEQNGSATETEDTFGL